MAKDRQETGSTISTVETAFSILETIGAAGRIRPASLAKELGLVRANVHRLLRTLDYLGYVERDESGQYHLTFSLFELGNTVPHSKHLIDTARPSMLRLAQLTGETVNNGVLFEGEVLYIDKVETTTHLKLDREIGSTDPPHCTSLGKVLLAFQGRDRRTELVSNLELVRRTENTITDPWRLEEELERVLRQGYAVDTQELSHELNCVAAPVFDGRGILRSAISVSGPALRFTHEKIEALVGDLKATAREITRSLSSFGPDY